MADDKTKQALVTSAAGMRLVAQTTLLNKADFQRVRQYLQDNYAESALAEQSAALRLIEMKAARRMGGRLKVEQVIGVDKYRVIAALSSEKGDVFLVQMVVEEEYPHKILAYDITRMEPSSEVE